MKLMGWDWETDLIGEPDIIPKPVCVSFHFDDTGEQGIIVNMPDMEESLKSWLEDDDIFMIAHNLTFELCVAYKYFPKLRPLLWDKLSKGLMYCSQLGQQLLDNVSKTQRQKHNLAALLKHYYKIDISDTKTDPDAWRLRYKELRGVPLEDWPQAAIDYAIMDSVYTVDIYKKQIKKRKGLLQKEHLEASLFLNISASFGMLISEEKVHVLETEIDAALQPNYDKLIELGYMERDKKTGKYKRKMKLLQEYLQENIGILKKTPKGGTATGGDELDYYLTQKPGDEVITLFRNILDYAKTKSAFVERLKTADPYIYTSYNAIVRSGRTSSRTTKFYPSVNIQQQPRAVD